MLFKATLGDLDWKMFFLAQLWWAAFNISFAVIFIMKTQESFLKSYFKLCMATGSIDNLVEQVFSEL